MINHITPAGNSRQIPYRLQALLLPVCNHHLYLRVRRPHCVRLVIWCAEYVPLDQVSLGLPIPYIDEPFNGLHLFEAEAPEVRQGDGSDPMYNEPAVETLPQPQPQILASAGLFGRDSDLFAYWQSFDPHFTNPSGSDHLPDMYPWFNPGEWEGNSS